MRVTSAATARVENDDGGTCNLIGVGELLPPASTVMGRLRASLAETARLLDDFTRDQQEEPTGVPDVETYRKCCRQLVAYIATQMETSEGFTEDMEDVIEASCSGFALRSLVARDLWVRYKGSSTPGADFQTTAVPSTPVPRGTAIKTDTGADGAITVTPLAVATASVTELRQTYSSHVDLTVSTPPTVGRGGKRQLQGGRVTSQEAKRARHPVARNLYDAGTLNFEKEDSELWSANESETESDTEMEACGHQRSEPGDQATALQRGKSGGGIVWPCAGGTPSEITSRYKQRLKAAVNLVDAENCLPPSGMVCMQGCARIRTQMCETHRTKGGHAMPCHNGTCSVWREIDTHLVRCQNSQCEFKNIVGLRQTMHDIQQQEFKLRATSNKLQVTQKMLDGVDFVKNSQLESKIDMLKKECSKIEDLVAFHKERARTFINDLNAVGSPRANVDINNMPTFDGHYAKAGSRE